MLDHREIIRILKTVCDSLGQVSVSERIQSQWVEPKTMDEAVLRWSVAALEAEQNWQSLLDEIGALQALCVDLQHQKDCLDSERANIRALAESRRAH